MRRGPTRTKQDVFEELTQYKTLGELIRSNVNLYNYIRKYNWLDEFKEVICHVEPKRWTKLEIASIAKQYKTRADFITSDKNAYQAARRYGWLECVCSHMKTRGNKHKRCVYIISNNDECYIGITMDLDRRIDEHKKHGTNCVKRLLESGGEVTKLTEYIPAERAASLEIYYISEYQNTGFSVLNQRSGGELGGNSRIWNKDAVSDLARRYNVRQHFKNNHESAYSAARRYGWLDEVCSHMNSPKGKWTHDAVIEAARAFNSKTEFQKALPGAYRAAWKNDWLDDAFGGDRG